MDGRGLSAVTMKRTLFSPVHLASVCLNQYYEAVNDVERMFFHLQATSATERSCNSSITCHHNNYTLIVLTRKTAEKQSLYPVLSTRKRHQSTVSLIVH